LFDVLIERLRTSASGLLADVFLKGESRKRAKSQAVGGLAALAVKRLSRAHFWLTARLVCGGNPGITSKSSCARPEGEVPGVIIT
jgi:hypothetical protein